MNPVDVTDLIHEFGVAVVVIALLVGAVSWLGILVVKEMRGRTQRSEDLFDKFDPAIRNLTSATNEQTQAIREQNVMVNALLDEWRRSR